MVSGKDVKNPHENSHTIRSEDQSKRDMIIKYYKNNPGMKAQEIAQMVNTSIGYVWNVLSEYKKGESFERKDSRRLYDGKLGRGLYYYEDAVLRSWIDELDAPVVNQRTGMKQIGFKNKGDSCSCQLHRNGKILIFPHKLDWKEWLSDRFIQAGWDSSRSEHVVNNCQITCKIVEAGFKVPDGHLPDHFLLKTSWGYVLVKDNSPMKNTLDLKINIPDLERYLGLPEIKNILRLLMQGSQTTNQLLRASLALLLKNKTHSQNIDSIIGNALPNSKSNGRFKLNSKIESKKIEILKNKRPKLRNLDKCIHGLEEAKPSICYICERYAMRMDVCPLIKKIDRIMDKN